MPRLLLRILAISLPLGLASPAIQGQMLLKPQSIQVLGTQQYTAEEVGRAAGVITGQTYTSDSLSQTAQTLMATGMFQKVEFKFDGRNLTYLIADSPDLYSVLVGNLPLPPGVNIDSVLRAKVPLYRGKVPSEGTVLDAVQQILQSMLTDEGIRATVVAVPAGSNPGKKATAMCFLIKSPAVKIGEIQVNGIPAALQSQIPKPSVLALGDYSNDQSAAQIEDYYRTTLANQGYAAATVRAQRAGDLLISADAIHVPFVVNVTPGRVYKLGKVDLAPGLPFTMEQLESALKPRSGYSPENSYVGAVIAEVTRRLKSTGYLDCTVSSHPRIDESSGVVNYVIAAATGPVYHLAFVKFENVSDQLRSLLMRNWQMMPGDPFNEIYVSTFILSEQKSNPILMRSLTGVKAAISENADPESHDVNLTIRLSR